MPIMPEILEIPEMSIILTRGMDGSVFSDGSDRSEEGVEDSEDIGGVRKKGGSIFGEKRV